jgi:NAD+ kinase
MRAVGLVPHRERPEAHALARSTAEWLRAHEVEVRVPDPDAEIAGLAEYGVAGETFADGLDLVCSLGGDGTMLYTVQLVYPAPAPVIGVNVGHLGYLTEIEPAELPELMPRLVAREFEVSERMMLEVEVESSGPAAGRHWALNEVVLEKQRGGRMIHLHVSINGSPFTSYGADGVIVATPTGTTAYSFSARGPIASPAMRCLVLTPLSPHMLFDRSLVLGDREELEFAVPNSLDAWVTIDGREFGGLNAGDRVRCRVAKEPLRLASVHPRDFHQILKTKFSLPDR